MIEDIASNNPHFVVMDYSFVRCSRKFWKRVFLPGPKRLVRRNRNGTARTLPVCRAQTCLCIIKVAMPPLRHPTVVRAVRNIASFSFPVFGTFALESIAAVIEFALASARAIIGTHIETANVKERRFVSNETAAPPAIPLINKYKSDAELKLIEQFSGFLIYIPKESHSSRI